MAAVPVVVKHQGKKYELELDPTSNGETFKFQLYSLTGVEPERQKILVKGGQLKDDTDLGSLKLKAGHSFMMMGTPAGDGNGLQRPKERTKFVEDMTEAEVAKSAGAQPAGLQNLGNTCYLNSTLQTLRIVPELQDELMKYKPTGEPSATSSLGSLGLSSSSLDLTAALRDLYKQMSETQEGFPPLVFLNALRTQFPQFAQKAKNGHGFAQQDAEEAWTEILAQLRLKLKQASSPAQKSVIEKYFALSSKTSIECDDPAAKEKGEEAISGEESALKLDCHIDSQINHLRDGILAGLKETLEKRSPTLERDALYTKTSRLSRLPKYLTVHFVRFFWKRDSQKKAKILRKVTFPPELDVVEFCTDDLKKKLVPVRDKIRDVRKEVEDVERAKKRQKRMRKVAEEEQSGSGIKEPLAKKKKAEADKEKTTEPTTEPEQVFKTDDEIDAERAAAILAAKKELLSLVDPELAADDGANTSGIYELRGVITHQGASADSGHYTSYVKKEGIEDPNTGKMGEEDGNWWWFNDDKVSEVSADKVETLSGGG
ncbi:MAG: deubiquitinating enzyme [Vezdaea aestivalis]|nr:MAG: deubiquitinating enzyme [Vezdaea aestivalis]